MRRIAVLSFGLLSYASFHLAVLYLVGFIAGVGVPTQLRGPSTMSPAAALAIDVLLVAAFGLQHSVMARPEFKRRWTRFIPAPIERSVYVLASSLALALLFWLWQPIDVTLWNVSAPTGRMVAWSLFVAGCLIVPATTFLINHFDLFGLRQAWLYFRGREYTPLPFVIPGPYRYVRHPLYVGWLCVFWATPTMTLAHFAFAASMTLYILIAIHYEERDLARSHADYAEYRRRVPMLLPRLERLERLKQSAAAASAATKARSASDASRPLPSRT